MSGTFTPTSGRATEYFSGDILPPVDEFSYYRSKAYLRSSNKSSLPPFVCLIEADDSLQQIHHG